MWTEENTNFLCGRKKKKEKMNKRKTIQTFHIVYDTNTIYQLSELVHPQHIRRFIRQDDVIELFESTDDWFIHSLLKSTKFIGVKTKNEIERIKWNFLFYSVKWVINFLPKNEIFRVGYMIHNDFVHTRTSSTLGHLSTIPNRILR